MPYIEPFNWPFKFFLISKKLLCREVQGNSCPYPSFARTSNSPSESSHWLYLERCRRTRTSVESHEISCKLRMILRRFLREAETWTRCLGLVSMVVFGLLFLQRKFLFLCHSWLRQTPYCCLIPSTSPYSQRKTVNHLPQCHQRLIVRDFSTHGWTVLLWMIMCKR